MRFIILCASFSALLAVGCDGHTSVEGRVVDPDKKPIPKATVRIAEIIDKPGPFRSLDTMTDEEGHFAVGMTHAPRKTDLLLEVSKDGYVTYEEKITGSANYEKEIVLEAVEE